MVTKTSNGYAARPTRVLSFHIVIVFLSSASEDDGVFLLWRILNTRFARNDLCKKKMPSRCHDHKEKTNECIMYTERKIMATRRVIETTRDPRSLAYSKFNNGNKLLLIIQYVNDRWKSGHA